MPSLEELVALLEEARTIEKDRPRAAKVASHLVEDALKEQWQHFSEQQRQVLVLPSTDRLWNSYVRKVRYLNLSPHEAAKEAIAEERTLLKQL